MIERRDANPIIMSYRIGVHSPECHSGRTTPGRHKRGTSAIAFEATGLAASSPVGRDTRLLTAILCGLDRCGRCHVARDERVSVCCVGLQGFNC